MSREELPHPKVVVTARNAGAEIVLSQEVALPDWYDGSHPIIDEPQERARLGIRSIAGSRTNVDGRTTQSWRLTYDAAGIAIESTSEDSWEVGRDASIAAPAPGHSAADQIRALGLFKSRRDRNHETGSDR